MKRLVASSICFLAVRAHAQTPESMPPAPRSEEVRVRGNSRASALRRSANAVTVIDTEDAKRQTVDLGEVLVRNSAVTVQRGGGLGSRSNFSLGGLGGERLRFFLDGVPLELMGYPAGVANVPVNLIDRVEVYQGVVPVRFGADALGGAVHLVSDESVRKSRGAASYQMGSFGTHRATLSARYFHAPSGVFARSATFLDSADNDYRVDVTAYDPSGRTYPATLPRFHDGYRGMGTTVGVGVIDKPWATRLVLQGFVSAFDNDVQNGATMARPYGEVTFERRSAGVNVKYMLAIGPKTHLDAVAGYARLDTKFRDRSNCVYDWYGRCAPRPAGLSGEISANPIDRDLATDTFFLRSELSHRLSDDHLLRFALAPTFADQSGKDLFRSSGYDPLAQPRRLFTGVIGVELESGFFFDRVKNIAFVKGYGFSSQSQALLSTGQWSDMSRDIFRGGGGDSVRVNLTRELYVKGSYELAMRQPSTEELFGNGLLIADSLGLRPETSHNVNVGAFVEDWKTPAGIVRASANAFARWSDDLIAPLAQGEYLRFVNVSRARTLGVDTAIGWTVPGGDWLSVDGRLTYQDLRNISSEGDLATERGDRIPYIPYLFSSASVRLRGRRFIVPTDLVELTWNVRHVHSFLLGWESRATGADRVEVDAQIAQGAALTYALRSLNFGLGMTLEVQNLTDAKLFDFYGVQRPGRAFFTKWTLDY